MKINLKQTGLLIFGALLFNACTGQPNIPKVTEQESMSYIHKFDKEYNEIKKGFKDNTITKWVQPSNKKEKCEIEVNFGTIDRTQEDSYKLFWDGECKNGKANGLGRVFETSDTYEQSIITIYKKGKISNACIVKRKFDNTTLMGECRGNELDLNFDFTTIHNNGTKNNFNIVTNEKLLTTKKETYNVTTKIYDDLQNFHLEQKYGTYGNINSPISISVKSPFIDSNVKLKLLHNFRYQLTRYNNGNLWYGLMNNQDKNHGFQFKSYSGRNGHIGKEMKNDSLIRLVQLPKPFFIHLFSIEKEIDNSVVKAEIAY
jgi:hypothetical protein